MAYATPADIESRIGRDLDDSEAVIVSQRLDDAELVILSRIPDVHVRVQSGDLSADVVSMIEADSVIRVLRNPEGIVGETDGNYSYQLNWATVSGRLAFTDDEWRLLGRTAVTTIAPSIGSVPRNPDKSQDALYSNTN